MADFWRFRKGRPLHRGKKTLIMGIVNLTPDSFSGDGHPAPTPREAAQTAAVMAAAGADIIDFGAESSRPGADTISPEEEIRRLGDTIALARALTDAPLSVDTYHPETAAAALEQGADIINDITALRGGWDDASRHNPRMADLAARKGAHVIVMHMPSPPAAMRNPPPYADVVAEVADFLAERAEFAESRGVPRDRIWLDPGFGFGKGYRHNQALLRGLGRVTALGFPVLVGLSRKRMIADALGLEVGDRLEASLALAVMAALNGAAAVRVHDVKESARALGMVDAMRTAGA